MFLCVFLIAFTHTHVFQSLCLNKGERRVVSAIKDTLKRNSEK